MAVYGMPTDDLLAEFDCLDQSGMPKISCSSPIESRQDPDGFLFYKLQFCC